MICFWVVKCISIFEGSTPAPPETTTQTTQKTTPKTTTKNPDKCAVSNLDKLDCGIVGTNEIQCLESGCCWEPVDPNPSNVPWCFHGNDYDDPCKDFTWTADGPGFTNEFYDIMFKK